MHIEDEIKLLERAIQHFKLPMRILGIAHTNENTQQVEVEYKFSGRHYNYISQSIEESSSHRVKFVFGFGYPHLPPRCYPIDPVFHPAFDQDTIQIQDFWEISKSFVELVFYVGKLISGQKTTVENPFNLNAAKWYKEHLYELPFSSVNLSYTLSSLSNRMFHEVDTKQPEVKNLPVKTAQKAQSEKAQQIKKQAQEKEHGFAYRYAGLLVVCAFLIYCANVCLSYYETSQLDSAELTLSECKAFAKSQKYREALDLCNSIENDLKFIYKNKDKKQKILTEARNLIVSENLIQNLNRKPQQQEKKQQPVETLEQVLSKAKTLYANGEYKLALDAYNALKKRSDVSSNAETLKEINDAIVELEFLNQLDIETEKLSFNTSIDRVSIFKRLDVLYNKLEDKASFAEHYEKFKNLVSVYEYCKKIIYAYQRNRYAEVKSLHAMIEKNEDFFNTPDGVAIEILAVKAAVYLKLNAGKKSYERNNWSDATNAFADSLRALEDLESKLVVLSFSFTNADTKEIEDILKYAKIMYARSAVNYKYELGEFYQQRGDRSKARKEFEEALFVFDQYPSELSNMRQFKKRIEEKLIEVR